MIAEVSAVTPEMVSEGLTVFYSETGFRTLKGNYVNNKKTGVWVSYFENEKDSSVYEIMIDGKPKYTRKSSLQKEEIHTVVEIMAEFPGGKDELVKFMKRNLTYPHKAKQQSIGGKAVVKFIVNEDGYISGAEVVKSTGISDLDEEAIRIIQIMPKWKPALINAQNVKCYFNLPVTFAMYEPYFIFEDTNKSSDYLQAKTAILAGEFDNALSLYVDKNDAESIYNAGVLYYLKGRKGKAKKYFENLVANTTDARNTYRKASESFLTNSF